MRAHSKSGVSLGGTLLAVSVLSLLAFTLAGLCVTHLRLTSQQDNGVLASNAARSAVSAAISKVIETKTFGKERLAEQEIRIETSEAQAYLTFNEEAAEEYGLPFSTNNLEGTEDAPGANGVLVPSATVHLSAIGRSGNAVRRVDAVLRVPPFPWAIASAGRIETRNGVVVAALPPGMTTPPADPEELRPADLLANGNGSNAIVLGNNSKVLGDVETPGQVVLGGEAVEVRGEIRSGSEPIALPAIEPTDYDPETKGLTNFPVTQADVDAGLQEVTGFGRAEIETLRFEQPLKLTNGQLYVQGNLVLNGGVQGSGLLIATGDITIRQGANLEGTTELAVLSGGRVGLEGGASTSSIRGLFYAAQGLDASQLTLVGSLLTGNASTGVTLDQVNVYYEEPPTIVTTAPTSTGGLPEGEFNVGRCLVSDNIMLAWFKPVEQPMPPDMEPLFRLRLVPTNGDFPVQVSVLPGVIDLGASFANRTLANRDEAEALSAEIETQVPFAMDLAGFDPKTGNANQLMTNLRSSLAAALGSGTSGGGSGAEGQPTVSLYGDISRFLPIEDRVRLISWVEY